MAKLGMPDVGFLLIDGADLLGKQVQSISVEISDTLEETTGSGDNEEAWDSVGITAGTITHEGLLDDTATVGNHALLKAPGATRVVAVAIGGNTIGLDVVLGYSSLQSKYNVLAALKSLSRVQVEYTMNKKLRIGGKILQDLSAETGSSGDTESSSVDATADSGESTDGGIGVLQVTALALGGYDNVVVKVRHSTDDIAFSDLITFTAVTTANASEGIEVTGTINRYLASSYAFTGAGSGQSVTFMVGFARLGIPAATP